MARVTYGPLVTELAGSIGGVTFQKNASGNTARLRPVPTVNPTSLQSGFQGNLSSIVNFWPTLTQAQKDDWDTHASIYDHTTVWGESKTLSGYQWFVSCNLNHLLFFSAPFAAKQGFINFTDPDAFTLEISSTYIRLAWASPYTFTFNLALYISLPLRQSSLKLRRSLFLLSISPPASPLSTWDITSLVESFYNVTWSTFFNTSDVNIIARLRNLSFSRGWSSAYTSAIIKVS